MPIIRDYFRHFSETDHLSELTPIIIDAIEFTYTELTRLWEEVQREGRKKKGRSPVTPINWERLPGKELGFEPMDVQIYKKIHGSSMDYTRYDVLSGTTKTVTLDEKLLSEKGFNVHDRLYVDRFVALCDDDRESGDYRRVYSFPSVSCIGRGGLPLLCNLSLGEVYYVKIGRASCRERVLRLV